MKKTLIVLSCVALLLPVAALSVFADTRIPVTFTNSTGVAVRFRVQPLGASYSYDDIPIGGSVTKYLLPDTVFEVYCSNASNDEFYYLRYVLDASSPVTVSSDSSNPSSFSLDDSPSFVIGTPGLGTSIIRYFSFVSPPPVPFEELGVNDGVDSSISYTGQVLHFLSTNSTTIVLIGLSVAMFAVLPFAIRKIKQIIKGY